LVAAQVTVVVQKGVNTKYVKRKHSFALQYKTRKELAVAVFSLGNFVGGSLAIGQVFGGGAFYLAYFIVGIFLIFVLYTAAVFLMETK